MVEREVIIFYLSPDLAAIIELFDNEVIISNLSPDLTAIVELFDNEVIIYDLSPNLAAIFTLRGWEPLLSCLPRLVSLLKSSTKTSMILVGQPLGVRR